MVVDLLWPEGPIKNQKRKHMLWHQIAKRMSCPHVQVQVPLALPVVFVQSLDPALLPRDQQWLLLTTHVHSRPGNAIRTIRNFCVKHQLNCSDHLRTGLALDQLFFSSGVFLPVNTKNLCVISSFALFVILVLLKGENLPWNTVPLLSAVGRTFRFPTTTPVAITQGK